MTRKERVKKAVQHIQTDIVPYNVGLTILAYEKMKLYYNDPCFLEKIGNHIVSISRKEPEQDPDLTKKGFYRDDFGVIWNRTVDKDIGVPSNYPVNEKNVETYPFPTPLGEEYYKHIPLTLQKYSDCFIQASISFSFFERAWTLVGMEKVLISFVENPSFIETLFDRLTDWLIDVVRKFGEYPEIDAIRFGDDWGQQRGLIMGIPYWRKYIKPRLAKIYSEVKRCGKYVSIHSCGDIQEILPDLIEIGLDIFNPFQPEVMDVYKMKERYGDKLTFWGGISLQKTLSFGTPEDVRKEVIDRIEKIGKGGGYIAAPCHSITGNVPAENIDILIKTLQSQ
ncbi:MAG: uroporphyrinogen decarboxylase [Candidatus Omnitrophica bacterium]|nr:uroporphyrinogen decarboxylase [Candidatus Omnitrophota bacterium]MCM8777853.1 uroporphyrinogen decarboxylase [Candidatus Omnitrophota bacterium]